MPPHTRTRSLSFYYDISSLPACLAALQIGPLAGSLGAALRWCPVLLSDLEARSGAAAMAQAPDRWSAARAALGRQDQLRQAALHGLTLHPDRLDPAAPLPDSRAAMALLAAAPPAARPALTLDLIRACWQEGRDIASPDLLADLARQHGLASLPGADRGADALEALADEAAARGLFGVPTVWTGERAWWGHDRLPLLARSLRPRSPRDIAAPSSIVDGMQVRFFHDLSSPFSYLAATQLSAWGREVAEVVEWVPILLGGLFRSIGTPDVPLFAMPEARRRYFEQDLADWAAWWGAELYFPTVFPVRTVLALRVSLLEPRATMPLYRALWAEDRDIGRPEEVRAVLAEAGLGDLLIEAAEGPAVKQRLVDNTAEAGRLGACGVPTFAIRYPGGEEVLLWGQDRLGVLRGALEGRIDLRR